jgi:hypothetical protein
MCTDMHIMSYYARFVTLHASPSPKYLGVLTYFNRKYPAWLSSIRSNPPYLPHILPSCCNVPHCPMTLPLHCAPLILRLSPIYSTSSYTPRANRPCNPDQNTTPIYETYVVSIRAHYQLAGLIPNQRSITIQHCINYEQSQHVTSHSHKVHSNNHKQFSFSTTINPHALLSAP